MTPEQQQAINWFVSQLQKSEERYSLLMEQYHYVVQKLFELKEKNEKSP